MNKFESRTKAERTEVFDETAARLKIGRAAIIEKDYWVCWTLSQLFGTNAPLPQEAAPHPFLFKGGTSLSKGYGLIDRFSEDIDLTIERSLLEDVDAPADEPGISKNERKRRIDRLSERCAEMIQDEVAPFLRTCVSDLDGASIDIDPDDSQTVQFTYPYALPSKSYGGGRYVNSVVRLEFGARGALWPASEGIVTAYVAAEFLELFDELHVHVWVMDVQRTFWEKATILHAVACSEKLGKSERQSRHYADLARLAMAAEGKLAVLNTQLLIDVAEHKARYFPVASAKYELARPGTLRLSPAESLVPALRVDYESMREMFISDPPSFEHVLEEIAALELGVNQRGS